MANTAAVRSARMQPHSRGRSKWDEAPRNRLEKATEKGLGCAEIQRHRQAMNAGAPVGGRLADAAATSARECFGIPEAAVRGLEARRRSAKWGHRRAMEAVKWRRSPAMDGRGGEAPDGGDSERERQSKRPPRWGCGAEDTE